MPDQPQIPEAAKSAAYEALGIGDNPRLKRESTAARINERTRVDVALKAALPAILQAHDAEVEHLGRALGDVKRYKIGSDSEIGPPEPYEDTEGAWVRLDEALDAFLRACGGRFPLDDATHEALVQIRLDRDRAEAKLAQVREAAQEVVDLESRSLPLESGESMRATAMSKLRRVLNESDSGEGE